MMTSKDHQKGVSLKVKGRGKKVEANPPREAFVWIWLPLQTEPIVAGRLQSNNGRILFNYGKSYLERIHDKQPSIAIYEPELPLKSGLLPLLDGVLDMPNCIRDASPDSWGRRVIINKKMGMKGSRVDTNFLDELTYLLESGSDRIGALDFQLSPSEYIPRLNENISMEELINAVECVEKGIPLSPQLDRVLLHGSSIGGARPKVLIESHGTKYIAKFSSTTDTYNVIKAEFIAMRLASLLGLHVAPVELTQSSNKDVLLIQRFDRHYEGQGWSRKLMVSALTLLGLNEMMARYASYEALAQIIRYRFIEPKKTLREMFSRLVFNILCGNTDDHARNHAAFWTGKELSLTPAYDICPQARTGGESSQSMLILGNKNLSQLQLCLETAHNFLLSEREARTICRQFISGIKQHWSSVCEEAELSKVEQAFMWNRQFINPYSIIMEE